MPEVTSSDERKLWQLVTARPSWIHRRVDRVELDPDGGTTRHISFDLTIPAGLAIRQSGGVVAPLTLMTKQPLRRLDARDPHGDPAPVLGKADNGRLVHQMLLEALRSAAPHLPETEVTTALHAAVFADDPDDMSRRVEQLMTLFMTTSTAPTTEVAVVLALADDLTRQFLFTVLLPDDVLGRRVVVKVSFGEDLVAGSDFAFARDGRMASAELYVQDSAASAHFELRAPAGLRVASTRLVDVLGNEVDLPGPALTRGSTAHLTDLQRVIVAPGGALVAQVEIEPSPDGLTRQTCLATIFIAALLWASVAAQDIVRAAGQANRGGAVAAAALALPALFLTVQARRPEHGAVARALFVPRALNVATAALLYVTAVYVVLFVSDGRGAPLLWLVAVVQTIIAGTATAFQRRLSAEPPTLPYLSGLASAHHRRSSERG